MIYRACRSFESAASQREAAERLLAFALKREHGIAVHDRQNAFNAWGKPFLSGFPQVFYNISHCKKAVAAVLSSRRVGIDIEFVREYSPKVARRVCSQAEISLIESSDDPSRMFFRLWTLKESYIKALGVGMAFPLREAAFLVDENFGVKTELFGCRFRLIEDESGIITAACVMHEDADPGVFELVDIDDF